MSIMLPDGTTNVTCGNKGCSDNAQIRLLMSITNNNITQLRPIPLCQGHAFIAMGKSQEGKWVSCPCCEVWFFVKDASK